MDIKKLGTMQLGNYDMSLDDFDSLACLMQESMFDGIRMTYRLGFKRGQNSVRNQLRAVARTDPHRALRQQIIRTLKNADETALRMTLQFIAPLKEM